MTQLAHHWPGFHAPAETIDLATPARDAIAEMISSHTARTRRLATMLGTKPPDAETIEQAKIKQDAQDDNRVQQAMAQYAKEGREPHMNMLASRTKLSRYRVRDAMERLGLPCELPKRCGGKPRRDLTSDIPAAIAVIRSEGRRVSVSSIARQIGTDYNAVKRAMVGLGIEVDPPIDAEERLRRVRLRRARERDQDRAKRLAVLAARRGEGKP